jgi:hypothetical protein
MPKKQPVEREEPEVEDEQLEKDEPAEVEGAGPDGGDYEQELARYLQERIKPNLSRSTIPLLARSIAKDLAKRQQPESSEQDDEAAGADATDFERDMHELQAELGDEWILRFSVSGKDDWLTAERKDGSQRIDAEDAQGLMRVIEAIDEAGR